MIRRIPQSMREFFATESAGGVVLVISCIVALTFANSPMRTGYANFWHHGQGFINEGLMSIFFFLVGLEIKREFVDGDLRNPKSAALPIIAAFGGMLTPALIFISINHGGSGMDSWAVPMPTDIALSIGALALLGSKIDPAIKIFLLTLAIADDLGSLLVIGFLYSSGLNPLRILSTTGAVFLAWILPTRKIISTERLISVIHPWSSYLVIPVFVLANIGISIDFHNIGHLVSSPISVGISVGRVVGKLVGITLFSWLAVKLRIAKLPDSLSIKDISGAAALAGMGLTVSLFIADLAVTSPSQLAEIKIGLIISAIISASVGLTMLKRFSIPRV